jgi:hypothetical protein
MYTISVRPGPRIERFELSRIADPCPPPARGSGDCTFRVGPLTAPIGELQLKVIFKDGAGEATATYHMGTLPSKKQLLQVTAPPPTPDEEDVTLRVVMLFTDGQANQGIKDPERIVSDIKRFLATPWARDVTIHTFGFGATHNASLLRDLSDASQGVFYYVKSVDDLATLFADCLGSIVGTVAAGAVLRLTPGPRVRILEVLTTAPRSTPTPGDEAVEVELKELLNAGVRDIPVRLRVDRSAAVAASAADVDANTAAVRVLTAALRYRDALARPAAPREVRAELLLPLRETAYTEAPDAAVVEQVERHAALTALDEVRALADAGRVDAARDRARAAVEALAAGPAKDSALVAAIIKRLRALDEQLSSKHRWETDGRQCTNAMYGGLAMQRAVAASACTDVYEVQTQQEYTRCKMVSQR